MRKVLVFVLAATLLLFAACSDTTVNNVETTTSKPEETTQTVEPVEDNIVAEQPTEEPTPEPTEEPTEEPTPTPTPEPTEEPTPAPTPEPETEAAIARVDEAGVIGAVFSVGDTVEVKGETDDGNYYIIAHESGDLMIEKWLVRMEGEEAPEPHMAYARGKTEVFANTYLEQEPIAKLSTNKQVTVEDEYGTIARVTLADGTTGYTRISGISKNKIKGGGGGGSSGGQDGGDIHIGTTGPKGPQAVRLGGRVYAEETETFTPGNAVVLGEGAEGYIHLFTHGDEVRVLTKDEKTCEILVGERIGTIPTKLLIFADEQPYEAWDGYAKSKSVKHNHYRMLDEGEEMKVNTSLHIVGEFEDTYIVEKDGKLSYVLIEQVSKKKITGGGSGGSSGGWTDPVL